MTSAVEEQQRACMKVLEEEPGQHSEKMTSRLVSESSGAVSQA